MKNRKGFMLAEVVVVSVVIATILVTIFTGLNNVSSAYKIRNKYYDVDSLYVAMEINDILRYNAIIPEENEIINLPEDLSLYVGAFIESYNNNSNFKYRILSAYFVPYDSGMLESLKVEVSNATFKDYVDYLSGNLNFNDDYDYMIIVERENNNDENDCYYYALKLKY